jgi:hypothetical protein
MNKLRFMKQRISLGSVCRAIVALVGTALLVTACGKSEPQLTVQPESAPTYPFSIELSPAADADSTLRKAKLCVAVNDHYNPASDTLAGDLQRCCRIDSLQPDAAGNYRLTGSTRDVAELYIATPQGTMQSLFAAADGDYRWTYGRQGITATDSLNGWLQETASALRAMSPDSCLRAIDSICRRDVRQVRSALLVRELLPSVADTLSLRRSLGHLASEAKPVWVMYDIDHRMDERYRQQYSGLLNRSFKFADAKGATLDLAKQNRGDMLFYFWADYDAASVSALRRLESKGGKATVVTFCLHAADSGAWRKAVASLPGQNVWIKAGLNHPMLRAWGVERTGLYVLANSSARVLYRGMDEARLNAKLDSIPKPRTDPRIETRMKNR